VFEYFDSATEKYCELPMPSSLTVDNTDAYAAACIAGLGIAQIPKHSLERYSGQLVEVLPELTARPLSIALLHTHGRAAPRRVRVVMTWLADLLSRSTAELVQ
jgi:DNA-binding transcriptional LysR family regulator